MRQVRVNASTSDIGPAAQAEPTQGGPHDGRAWWRQPLTDGAALLFAHEVLPLALEIEPKG